MSGSSAGAHLTALCAFTQNDRSFQPGFPERDTSLTAAICLNGYYGDYYESGGRPSSPFDYVRRDAPPFFVAHGDLDTEVPVEQARSFSELLRKVSRNEVVSVELPGGQHAFDLFHSPRFEAVIDGIDAFAAAVRPPRQHNALLHRNGGCGERHDAVGLDASRARPVHSAQSSARGPPPARE
jgi:acetyl esterase/lipase